MLNAFKEFANRVETIHTKGLTKSERVKAIFNALCSDISITTIEKA